MRKVATAMEDGTADEVLLEAFNDDMLQNYVITHLRVLDNLQLRLCLR